MMSEWEEVRLDSIVEFLNAKRIPLSSQVRSHRQGEYPYYGASGIVDYLDDYIFDGKYLLISEDGENLNTRKTPIAFIAEGKYWVNNHAHILDEKEVGILEYLKYYFSTLNISPYITGAVQPKLNKGSLSAIPITLPSKNIRVKINKVLSTLDDKIELNRKMNQTLEEMAQALFKSWFVDFDPVHVKMGCANDEELESAARELGISKEVLELFPSEFEESELGMIPKGFVVSTIGDKLNVSLGGTPSRANDSYWTNGTVAWINSGKVNEFRITEASEMITEEAVKKSSTKLLPKKTTVLAITGATLGQVSLLEIDSCANQSVIGLSETEELNHSFIYPCICNAIKDLISHQTGGAQQHINKANVENYQIIIPASRILDKFVSISKPLMEQITNNSFEIQTLQKTRDTLLPKLLSGELDVSKLKL